MERTLFGPEHRDFRDAFRTFLERHVAPGFEEWERRGIVPADVFSRAGSDGFLAFEVPAEYGGTEVDDFRFNAIVGEEASRAGYAGFASGISLHNDVCLPYLMKYGDEEQRHRWLPGVAAGDLITALALTEPGTGSDLAGIATTAERVDGGYRVNGSKTFITNGINADLVVTAARTDPGDRHGGLSLLVIPGDSEGFERGRNLDKMGLHSQDTAELFFSDVFVPVENLLGEEGQGFSQLVSNLPRERLAIAVAAVAATEGMLAETIEYVRSRKAFGKSIGSFQNTRFVLAEVKAELDLIRSYVDRSIELQAEHRLTAEDAAIGKWWSTEVQGRAADRCLQLFGGYGYMLEYPLARAYMDARVTRIYGGTTEVMKEIVGRSLGL